MNSRHSRPGPAPTMADLQARVGDLAAFSDRANTLLVSSIRVTKPVFSDPGSLMGALNQINSPEELLNWASSLDNILQVELKQYSPQPIEASENLNERYNIVISGYITALTHIKTSYSDLQKWLNTEKNLAIITQSLTKAIQQAIDAYMLKKVSVLKSRPIHELVAIAQSKFGSVCDISLVTDKECIRRQIKSELLQNPMLFMQSVNGLLEKFRLEKGLSSDSLDVLTDALNTNNFRLHGNQIVTNNFTAAVFAQRKSELLAICNRLDAAKTMLISEKDKINNYTAFEKNILSRVIDALKYRRERTRGKTHNLFANKELCESRVTILTNYISQLEAGFCQTTAELNALLEKLRIDNSSKNLPFRVVDKLGGLNKLLVSHSINNNDFDMFDEPCNKYRRNG